MTRSVALFASSFSPHVGGVEEVVHQLALQQSRSGERPMVLTMRWPKDLPSFEHIDGLPIRRHVFRLPEPTPRFMLAYSLENRRIQRQVNRQVFDHGANVVHVHCVSGNGYYALRAARRLGLPLVVTLHGELTMDAGDIYRHSRVLPKLLYRLMADADAVTACSAQTLAEAQDFTGLDLGDRGSVIRGGVDVREFAIAQPELRDHPYLLAAGRHVHPKGLDILIDAYSLVLSRHPDAPDLVIAGDGEEHAKLKSLAVARGIADRIEFAGRCDRTRIAMLFKGCTAFVLPSRHEALGIVNMEAMAAGKPVIATRVGGVPEIVIDGVTGLLTSPGDPVSLADSMCRLIENPAWARSLGVAGSRRVPSFDWLSVSEQYGSVYHDARERASYRNSQ
jgi:glycogen(starch) synthase